MIRTRFILVFLEVRDTACLIVSTDVFASEATEGTRKQSEARESLTDRGASMSRMLSASVSILVIGVVAFAGSARAADSLSAGDKRFLEEAGKAGMMEIQMGRLGQSSGS